MDQRKSHVGMECKLCPVCREEHPVGVLLDTRLRDTIPRTVNTGMQLCPAHQAIVDGGHVFVIEIDPAGTTLTPDGMNVAPQGNIEFLSGIVAICRDVVEELVNLPVPEAGFVFCDHDAMMSLLDIFGDTIVEDDHPKMKLTPQSRMDD